MPRWIHQVDEMVQKLNKMKEQSSPAPNRLDIIALHFDLDLLEYMITAKSGWEVSPGPAIGNPICSEPGCKADWRAGLLNHAAAGFDPVWYCMKHVKSLEHSHHVPGTPERTKELMLAKAREEAAKWGSFVTRLEAEREPIPDLPPDLLPDLPPA